MTITGGDLVGQHSVGRSVSLHILPGLLIGAVYFGLIPVISRAGYPSIMTLMLAVASVLIPFQLGFLLVAGFRKNRKLSLHGIISYRTPIPFWQYLVFVPLLFAVIGLIFTFMKPADQFFRTFVFHWMPPMESGLNSEYSRVILVQTYLMVAIFGTVAGPFVEELYFRGYLLPRMGYAGRWAPLFHSFLFALYHVFTPWMIVTRTLGMLPLIYVVKRRNITISIIVHIFLNSVDVILGVLFIRTLSG